MTIDSLMAEGMWRNAAGGLFCTLADSTPHCPGRRRAGPHGHLLGRVSWVQAAKAPWAQAPQSTGRRQAPVYTSPAFPGFRWFVCRTSWHSIPFCDLWKHLLGKPGDRCPGKSLQVAELRTSSFVSSSAAPGFSRFLSLLLP